MRKFLLLLVALAFLAACSKEAGTKSGYVVKIDGATLTKEDVQNEMNSLPEMAKQFFQGPDGATRFIDELVKKEMLYMEAKKRGMDQTKEFQKKVEEFKKISLINALLEKEIEAGSKPSDKDIKDFYDSHKDDFTVNDQVKVSQIVVKGEDDLKKVVDRLKAGEDFGKVASEMSIDKASAKSGGTLGSFKKGEMSPQLEDAVFRLKKGEVSTPIRLKDGIHILKVTDAKGTLVGFDKVKALIGQRLTAEKQKANFDKFVEGLKKTYKIDVNKDAVSKLNLGGPEPGSRPAPPMPPTAAPAPGQGPAPAKK
ncbi:MAG TPA: peptidylprolyl isomerase [Dissulfurispiraceae bacterium]